MSSARFLTRLEALRGVAAFMVGVSHTFGAIRLASAEDFALKKAIYFIGNGGAAVTIFFVLSGYVLGLSLDKAHVSPLREWPAFIWRRILRIYPAMTFNLLFCWFWIACVFSYVAYPAVTEPLWHLGATWRDFATNMVFANNYLNPVIWTLQVEMLGSLVFPLLFFIKSRSRVAALVLLAAWLVYFIQAPLYSYWRTGFIFMFIVGLFVGDVDEWMRGHLKAPWARPLIAGVSLLVCCSATVIWTDFTSPWPWVLHAFSACVLVAALAGIPREMHIWVLDLRVTRYLGRISYSFYLWHLPVLVILGSWIVARVDNTWVLAHPFTFMAALLVVTVPVTTAISHFSHKWLEKPFKGGGWIVRSGEALLGRGAAKAV